MSRKTGIIVVIAAGAVWGLTEVFVGDVFYRFHVPMRAASLTALGLAILVTARLIYDRPGTSLGAAVLAGALRCLVPKLYICHMIAIAIEGAAFDLSWSAMRAGERHSLRRAWLSAAIATFVGFFSFGLVGAHAFGFMRWVGAGLPGIASWSLRSGAFSSLLLLALVPLAALAARKITAAAPAKLEEKRTP
ncbi:MAG: hypothetical protein PVF95_08380 [bacterium]|jgi:hypothetical protein